MLKIKILIIIQLHLLSKNLSGQQKQVDFREYFIERERILNDEKASNNDIISFFTESIGNYGHLPGYGYNTLARIYDEFQQSDSAFKYLKISLWQGANPDEYLLEKYNLPSLLSCETCYFHSSNHGKVQLVLYMETIDQIIRRNGYDGLMNNQEIDELNITKLYHENLLSFKNSGYAQMEALIIALHGSSYFKKDTLQVKNYLIDLVKLGELDPAYCAMILDRYHYDLYGYQIYGKVRNLVNGEYIFVAPFLNPEKIDENRKNIGLLPIEEELRYEGIKKMSQPQKFKPN